MNTDIWTYTRPNYTWSFAPTYTTQGVDSYEHLYGKPAIYLYPEEDTYVTVNLDITNGELTKSDPDYQGGWNVFVTKDGTIYDENGFEYDYLFWEAESNTIGVSDTGWVVSMHDIEKWFEDYLDKVGLNRKEKKRINF